MKKVIVFFLCTFLPILIICSNDISEKNKINDAVSSIQIWLEKVDSGSYSESWSLTGKMFKSQLSDNKWAETLEKSRKPLGEKITRKLKSSKFNTSLPGVPDGEYVVVQFTSKFTKKQKAIETVTTVLEDEQWKVVGYYLK
jgi:hypothetical protein